MRLNRPKYRLSAFPMAVLTPASIHPVPKALITGIIHGTVGCKFTAGCYTPWHQKVAGQRVTPPGAVK
jgi:hypothetical protein